MAKPGKSGIVRIIDAAGYSYRGFRAAFKHEAAFRQELTLFIIFTPLAFWWSDNGVEYALMIGSLILVLITELLNSAIETVVDRVSDEYHELAGRAKDMGSAAVFLSLVNVILIWFFVLLL